MTTAKPTDENKRAVPAVGIPLDRRVGRPVLECADDDERYFGDCEDEYDDVVCDRCHGDGMDPWCDYLLPCPCQGEQRP